MRQQRRPDEEINSDDEAEILRLWRSRELDTYDIAELLGLEEWEVANRLFHIREAARA